jgi:hypothetical protein
MNVLKIIKAIVYSLKEKKLNIHFNKQWFDFREISQCPVLSLFVLEESPVEQKGHSFKQELSAHIEGYIASNNDDCIYLLVSDVKSALLNQEFPFAISYQGYEINLPEEGSQMVSVRVKFKIIYLENIH